MASRGIKKQTEEQITEKAVIYARFSSSGQRDESIDGQLRECRAYAERMNIRVVGEYCDYALSGTNDNRPEFRRMIKDSAKGGFQIVLVWKFDRFSRNRYDSAIYKTQLKKNDVRVVSAKEGIPDGPEGILLESMMEGFAEYYSANLSQNIKRGNYESALKLRSLGHCPYGLRRTPDGTLEPDPETAPVVRRIFEEYTSGIPMSDIRDSLNKEGYRTARGNEFDKSSLRRILQNEKYCGVYRHQDICVEGGIPAIISTETYEKSLRMLNRNHHSPAAKKTNGGYLLTGKLFCGKCGASMTADSGTGKCGTVYKYYTCNGRRAKRCDKARVPKEEIEDIVVEALLSIVFDDETIENFADSFMRWQEKKFSDDDELKALESRLRETESAIRNTMDVIDKGLFIDSIRAHLLELEQKKTDIESVIEKHKHSNAPISRPEIIHFMTQFREADMEDVRWRIFLTETFLQAAYLTDDDLILVLNHSGKDNKITLPFVRKSLRSANNIGVQTSSRQLHHTTQFRTPKKIKLLFAAGRLFIKVKLR